MLTRSFRTSPETALRPPRTSRVAARSSAPCPSINHRVFAMSTPTHKPRKKKKGDSGILANPRHGTVIVNPEDGIAKPAFPLVAFLWPAKGTVSQWVVLPLILIAVGLFRWATAFWGYSGSY